MGRSYFGLGFLFVVNYLWFLSVFFLKRKLCYLVLSCVVNYLLLVCLFCVFLWGVFPSTRAVFWGFGFLGWPRVSSGCEWHA